MFEPEFRAWPSTPRLFREMIITEKIDGTNACVIVSPEGNEVWAQSRKRLITPEDDNFGFAKWVHGNAGALADVLGPGYHYGEWWGSGVQRGYGLAKGEKRFSLFNTNKWAFERYDDVRSVDGMDVVPVLSSGATFSTDLVDWNVDLLRRDGSFAAPGYDNPEGVVVFHKAAGQVFKVLLENDDIPKSLVK